MNNQNNINQKSHMIIYTTEDGLTKIETTFDEDTVWLSIDQMAELFQRDKSTISRHIKNIYSEGELVQRELLHFLQQFKWKVTDRLQERFVIIIWMSLFPLAIV